MVNRLLTAEQVKQYLNITDFRHLSKDKLIEFVSAIPEMDKDVAIRIIEQFPEFTRCAMSLVSHYETMCESILRENGDSVRYVMEGYKQTLNTLGGLALDEKLDPADRRYFAEKMVNVADNMASFDTKNKGLLAGMTKYITWFIGSALLLGAVALGIKIKSTKIPKR